MPSFPPPGGQAPISFNVPPPQPTFDSSPAPQAPQFAVSPALPVSQVVVLPPKDGIIWPDTEATPVSPALPVIPHTDRFRPKNDHNSLVTDIHRPGWMEKVGCGNEKQRLISSNHVSGRTRRWSQYATCNSLKDSIAQQVVLEFKWHR